MRDKASKYISQTILEAGQLIKIPIKQFLYAQTAHGIL